MPKTNIRGGNKKKKGKNGLSEINRTIDYAVDGQLYGEVTKVSGSGRFIVNCFEKNEQKEFIMSEKICHVRGKLRKKVWINNNDLVLLSVRDFDKKKGDIIHKYTNDEARQLKKENKIPNIEMVNGKLEKRDDIKFEYNTNIESPDPESPDPESPDQESPEMSNYMNYKKSTNSSDEDFTDL